MAEPPHINLQEGQVPRGTSSKREKFQDGQVPRRTSSKRDKFHEGHIPRGTPEERSSGRTAREAEELMAEESLGRPTHRPSQLETVLPCDQIQGAHASDSRTPWRRTWNGVTSNQPSSSLQRLERSSWRGLSQKAATKLEEESCQRLTAARDQSRRAGPVTTTRTTTEFQGPYVLCSTLCASSLGLRSHLKPHQWGHNIIVFFDHRRTATTTECHTACQNGVS